MINKVNGLVLFVQDFDRSLNFYRDLLGLEVIFTDADSAVLRMEDHDFVLLKMAAAVQMVGEKAIGLKSGASNRVLLCADVENVDATYKELGARGVTFINPPVDQPWGLRTVYFSDPEGHLWELRHPLPAANESAQ